MKINNSANNSVSFGQFSFNNSVKELLKHKIIKTQADLDRFEQICKEENQDKTRIIYVIEDRSKLCASASDGVWHKQGFFQSALTFLDKFRTKADKITKKAELKAKISELIDEK